MNMGKFRQALDQNTYAAAVDKSLATGAQLGVKGTPHSLINGVAVGGAQPFDKFKEVIDAQLAKAQALIASGTKPDEVYIQLAKENRAADPTAAASASAKPVDPPPEDKATWKVPVFTSPTSPSPVRGDRTAPVTMVVFADYQCPFCKRVEGTIAQLRTDYGNKLRVVWKDRPLPFHTRAVQAATLCREARRQKGDAGFWACHDMLFETQKLEDADLEGYAQALGLNVSRVKQAIEAKSYEREIAADVALADQIKASGTPHMFINGRRVLGAQPIEKFKALIDEQMKVAEALIAAGIPAARVYDKVMENAQTAPSLPPSLLPALPPGHAPILAQ